MNTKLWRFTDNQGSFKSDNADQIRSLYFPLANDFLMSSVSPDLHGDKENGAFFNPQQDNRTGYKIIKVNLNAYTLPLKESPRLIIPRKTILALPKDRINTLAIFLS